MGGGGGFRIGKISVIGLCPSRFMILYLNRYHMTIIGVFKYTYCLRHLTVFQCVIQDQPLHRCLVVSSFYLCSFVSPMFQQGETRKYMYIKFCR